MARTARPVQVGEVIDYRNDGDEQIRAGDIVPLGSFCGVAECDMAPGELGAVAISQVWDVQSDAVETFGVGEIAYWDGVFAVREAGGNLPLGVVVEPKSDGDDVVRVKLGTALLGVAGAGGGGTFAGTAADVPYTNAAHKEWGNVRKALDGIIDKIEYVKPSVTSFTMTPSTTEYEIGQSVKSLLFSWAYNKPIKIQDLTDVLDAAANVETRSGSWSGTLTTNKTFTLTASDGTNSTSASKTISFKHRIYWGATAKASGFTSDDILGLANKAFADNYRGTRSFNAPAGQYAVIACPAAWNMPAKCVISGFETELVDCGSVQFTNASGNTTAFKIVRTGTAGLGAFSATFN